MFLNLVILLNFPRDPVSQYPSVLRVWMMMILRNSEAWTILYEMRCFLTKLIPQKVLVNSHCILYILLIHEVKYQTNSFLVWGWCWTYDLLISDHPVKKLCEQVCSTGLYSHQSYTVLRTMHYTVTIQSGVNSTGGQVEGTSHQLATQGGTGDETRGSYYVLMFGKRRKHISYTKSAECVKVCQEVCVSSFWPPACRA
jgi:hypothetical protein